jgi:LmbE family N-acetylglucosaminyl deacetylase
LSRPFRVEIRVLTVDPNEAFQGTVLIVAPHMDDEALACGGLIARLSMKERIHIIYATDGMKSPAPVLPRFDSISPELGEARVQESIQAMKFLGVPEENLHFLRLPEAGLKKKSPS